MDITEETDCAKLRTWLREVKRNRAHALIDESTAATAGEERPYTAGDRLELRYRVHQVAKRAREMGCNIDDLVGQNVGVDPFD